MNMNIYIYIYMNIYIYIYIYICVCKSHNVGMDLLGFLPQPELGFGFAASFVVRLW